MIYTIHRYPAHLIDVVRLADGSRVTIRPTLPQDIALQQQFFRSLPSNDRYARFMSACSELPPILSERFANIDYDNHLALLAEVFEAGREVMIGEARYVVDQHNRRRCEFAIAVAAAYQGSGLAGCLLQRLERQAATSGIQHMTADALVENRAMLRLAARAGYAVSASPGDATLVRLQKELIPSGVQHSVQPLAA